MAKFIAFPLIFFCRHLGTCHLLISVASRHLDQPQSSRCLSWDHNVPSYFSPPILENLASPISRYSLDGNSLDIYKKPHQMLRTEFLKSRLQSIRLLGWQNCRESPLHQHGWNAKCARRFSPLLKPPSRNSLSTCASSTNWKRAGY